jgi:hypothetical protein
MRLFQLKAIRNAYLLRSLILWAALRGAFLVFEIIEIGANAKVGIVVIVVTAVYLDARRRDEELFLANLGISGRWIALAAIPVPLLLEVLLP